MSIKSSVLHAKIGARLVEALNLPRSTTSVEVRFAAGEPIEVKCCFFPDPTALEPVMEQLAQFELKPKGEEG